MLKYYENLGVLNYSSCTSKTFGISPSCCEGHRESRNWTHAPGCTTAIEGQWVDDRGGRMMALEEDYLEVKKRGF